jgi:hypothetical protein
MYKFSQFRVEIGKEHQNIVKSVIVMPKPVISITIDGASMVLGEASLVLGGASLILGEASLILGEASTVMEIPAFIQNRPKTRPAWQGLGMERGLSQLAAGGRTRKGRDDLAAGWSGTALRAEPRPGMGTIRVPVAPFRLGWTNGAKGV